jgi:hypothetical protein
MSLAEGATHGPGPQGKCLSTPKGSNLFPPTRRPTTFNPLRVGKKSANRFRAFHPRLMTLDLFEVPRDSVKSHMLSKKQEFTNSTQDTVCLYQLCLH